MRADGTVASHGFGRSSVCHCVDTDSKAAAVQRKKQYADAAKREH
jgi:hypothetical protein